MKDISLFEEANLLINKHHNSNFYWEKVGTPERIWIRTITQLFEKRLEEYDKKLNKLHDLIKGHILL